jgi:myo-inositol 2-dehydrogenase/D-chiro-inositol 1-dehydrogenase
MSQRICYIGAGNFSSAFIHPQLADHGVELAAICDLDGVKAQRAAAKWGFEQVYTDFNTMLDEQQPDAIFCVGGPKVHYEVGMQVIDRGLPLYVQKSPAPTPAMAREMAQLAEERGSVCHVGFNLRSCPAVRLAKEAVSSPEFGAPSLMIFRYGLVSGSTWKDAVYDQHCHAADVIRHLLGEVETLYVETLGTVQDARGYVAAMRMKNGAVVTLNTTSEQDLRGEFIYFEVTGRQQHYVVSHDGDAVYHRPEGHDVCVSAGTYNPKRLIHHLGYFDDVRNFLAAAAGDEEDRCPVGDTIQTMELVAEIYLRCLQRGAPE